MILATNVKILDEFGFQLILDDSKKLLGVNLVYKSKILTKKRFTKPKMVINFAQEKKIISEVINEYFRM